MLDTELPYVPATTFLRPPGFPQHDEAYSAMIMKKYFALYPDLGTAKTFMLLRDFLAMWQAGQVDGILVIAPVGVHEQWINEELPATTNQRCVTAAWPEHPPMKRTWLPRIFTIYPEAFRRKPKPPPRRPDETTAELKARRKIWRAKLRDVFKIMEAYLQSGRIGLIVDEAQMMMHNKSKTSKRIRELKELAAYRRVASGDPAPSGLLINYYPQMTFLNSKILGCSTRGRFEEKFCQMGGFKGRQIVGNKNEKEFYRRVAPFTYTVKLDDCIDMPSQTFLIENVPLTDTQTRLIRQIKEEFKAELDNDTVYMPMVLQRLTRMQQIGCGFLPVKEDEDAEGKPIFAMRKVPELRTQTLENLLLRMRGKVVIWSRFSPCIERLTKHFGDDIAVKYRGGMDRQERADNKLRFTKDPKCKYIFAQYKSAGAGFNGLQVSRYTIYWSHTNDAGLRHQSERRTWRLGQERPCFYYDLNARGTYDYQTRAAVRNHRSLARDVLANIQRWKTA
jgi:hypothetical protein